MTRNHHLRQTHRRALWAGITLSVAVHAAVLGLGSFDAPDPHAHRTPTLVQLEAITVPPPALPERELVQLPATKPTEPAPAAAVAQAPVTPAVQTVRPNETDLATAADEPLADRIVLAQSTGPLIPQPYLDEIALQRPKASATTSRGGTTARSNDQGQRRGPAIQVSIGGRGVGGPGCTVTGRGFGFPKRQGVRRF
jgi:hypothetical protein